MTSETPKPVIFLAFANDRDEREHYLRNLPEEARRVRDVLEQAARNGLCELVLRQNATLAEVLDVFQDPLYRNRVAVFHYGGHANGYQLLLESAAGQHAVADASGLAVFLGQQRGMKLVFLNACSTQPQVQGLLDAQVATVIATSRLIDDAVATDFAARFYQGLAGGADIRAAYAEAEAAAQTAHGANPRALYYIQETAEDRWPWSLYLREGAEVTARWNLPEAVGDPLFGLPALPAQDLPESPFRHLNWFNREHAEVFFGRGHEIRDLYNRVTAPKTAPIILFYGLAGVGKSSVLAAGLLPRLEGSYEVRYVRRDRDTGLLGSLRAALGAAGDAGPPVEAAWLALESQVGKPVTVILDQAEEVFTQRNEDEPDELEQLLNALEGVFAEPSRRPMGKLVLSFRKEWLAEMERRLSEHKLWHTGSFLDRLGRAGVIEAVTGPARSQRLRAQYGLTVEEGLSELIADDLLADPDSPVAPTLQILLSKMWAEARPRDAAHPRFDQDLYQKLRRQGILMGDFLTQELDKLRAWRAEVVDSGLALDILAFHTTVLGTAEQRTIEELSEKYRHRADVLTSLLQQLQDGYLLVDPAQGQGGPARAIRLAHDTLAPLVRQRFEESDRPGQRARRILASRAVEWEQGKSGSPLDEPDLKLVEQGAAGMRAPTPDEQRLIEASRAARAAQQRNRRLLRIVGVAAVVFVLLAAAVAVWQGAEARAQRDRAVEAQATAESRRLEAERQAGIAKSRELAATDERIIDKDPELAVLLGVEAVFQTHRIMTDAITSEAIAAVHRAMARSPWQSTLRGHGDRVNDAAWSPDGSQLVTASADKTAKVWNAQSGQIFFTLPHSGTVNYAAWSPEGSHLVTASADGTAKLWESQTGQMSLTLPHSGTVNSAVWSPDNRRLVTASADNTARGWDAQTGRLLFTLPHSGTVNYAAWSPDGKRIVTASKDGAAKIWNGQTGQALFTLPHDGAVYHAAWSPDGKRIVTASDDKTAKVWNAQTGQKLFALMHDAQIRHAAWSLDGSRLVTASDDRTARVWEASTGRLLFTLPHDDVVNEAAWSTDGKRIVTASTDGRARVWDAQTGQLLFTLPHDGAVYRAVWNPAGSRLVTASADGTAKVWVPPVGQPLFTLPHDAAVWHAAWSPDGSRVISGSSDKTAKVWQTQGDQTVLLFTLPHTGTVKYSAWSPDGSRLVTASTDGTARVWDAQTGHPLFILPHGGWVNHAAWGPDGSRLATASADKTAKVWNPRNGQMLLTLPHTGTVNYVAWSPDGSRLVTASDDKTARVWEARTGQMSLTLPHTGTVNTAAWSPDGKQIVTASSDKIATVWDAQTGQMRFTLPHDDAVNEAVWNPDGKLIATVSTDGTAKVWEAQTGQVLFTLPHNVVVRQVAWSPDGRRIVTASTEGTAKVWDAQTGQALFTLLHDGAVYHAAWNPDGSRLVTASTDRAAHIFLAKVEGPGGLSEFACARTGRNMTGREWTQYMGVGMDYRQTCLALPAGQ